MCISSSFVILLLQRMHSQLARSLEFKPQPAVLPYVTLQLRLCTLHSVLHL